MSGLSIRLVSGIVLCTVVCIGRLGAQQVSTGALLVQVVSDGRSVRQAVVGVVMSFRSRTSKATSR